MDKRELAAQGLKEIPLKHDPKGRPILLEIPRRVEAMEQAAPELFRTLRNVSVAELKSLAPVGRFIPLVDALIVVRILMGGEGSC